MAIGDFVAAIGRRWWLVIATTVVAATIGFIFATTATPTYAATAQVTAVALDLHRGTDNADTYGLAAARWSLIRDRMNVYVFYADTGALAQRVVSAHQLSMTPDQLSRSLMLGSPEDTAIINVTVRSESPVAAADASNASADELTRVLQESQERRESWMPQESQKSSESWMPFFRSIVTERAFAPTSPIAPELWRTVAQSAVLGLIVGITAATGLALLRERREKKAA